MSDNVTEALVRIQRLLVELEVEPRDVTILLSAELWDIFQADVDACRQWNSTREAHKRMHEFETGEKLKDGPVRETTINGDLRVRKDG